MHWKCDIIEVMINDETNEVNEELFESLHSIYQIGLEESIKDADFIVDHFDLFYYKCHEMKTGES